MEEINEAAADGAAPEYRDPAFEFSAPRFYDFQRLSENVPSPPSQGEGYFDSSQTKGARPMTQKTGLHRRHQKGCSTDRPCHCRAEDAAEGQ